MLAKECIENRRSVRAYTEEPVSRETVEEIVAAARFAPTWKNSQTVRYIVVDSPELKEKIADNCTDSIKNRGIIKNAPVLVIVATKHGVAGYERDGSFTTSKGEHWESFDAGIATQTFCLAAYEKGLGTLIMGLFEEEKVIRYANIEEGCRVSALVALGHAEGEAKAPPRKEINELVSYR